MKFQVVVRNSLGEFKSEVKDGTQEQFDAEAKFANRLFDSYSFADVDGNQVIFQKELISNSVIKIVKIV